MSRAVGQKIGAAPAGGQVDRPHGGQAQSILEDLEPRGSQGPVEGVKEHPGKPFMIDPGFERRYVSKDILIGELSLAPEQPAKGQIAPKIRIRRGGVQAINNKYY